MFQKNLCNVLTTEPESINFPFFDVSWLFHQKNSEGNRWYSSIIICFPSPRRSFTIELKALTSSTRFCGTPSQITVTISPYKEICIPFDEMLQKIGFSYFSSSINQKPASDILDLLSFFTSNFKLHIMILL